MFSGGDGYGALRDSVDDVDDFDDASPPRGRTGSGWGRLDDDGGGSSDEDRDE
eukprot:gene7274-7601_t